MIIFSSDCEYSDWSEWTECSKPCDNGGKSRNRTAITIRPECNNLTEIVDCNTHLCPFTSKVFKVLILNCIGIE